MAKCMLLSRSVVSRVCRRNDFVNEAVWQDSFAFRSLSCQLRFSKAHTLPLLSHILLSLSLLEEANRSKQVS